MATIPGYLPDGTEFSMTPSQLFEYLRLQILAANSYNVPKFERAVEGVAKARAQGDLDPADCDQLDRMAARKRREIEAEAER